MHLHGRFLVSQTHETHNCKGLHALPKGKINHASKLIPSMSSNGLAYWSENYLSFFGYCFVLHLLHCFPQLFIAQPDKSVRYNMHVSQKVNQWDNIRHAEKPLVIQTKSLHMTVQECFELWPNSRNETVSMTSSGAMSSWGNELGITQTTEPYHPQLASYASLYQMPKFLSYVIILLDYCGQRKKNGTRTSR